MIMAAAASFRQFSTRQYAVSVMIEDMPTGRKCTKGSDAHFSVLTDMVPILIWISDPGNEGVYFNNAWTTFTGKPVAENLNHGWLGLIHPDDRQVVRKAGLDADECRSTYSIEFRLKRADGAYRWVLDTGTPRIEGNGVFAGFLHSCLDITERKAAEEAQAQLAALVESSDDAIISKSLSGIIQSWNDAAERIFGYSAQQAVDQHISLIIPPERLSEEDSIMRSLRAGKRVDSFETVRRRNDGTLIEVALTISPIIDRGGQIVGASKIARDITAQKRVQNALQESEERFRTLADNISQFAWMADRNGWIFWYNRRWYEYTGTTLEEMKGWGWRKVHHPKHVDRVVRKIQHSWDTGETWEDTFPLRGKDGKYRWFLSHAMPIRDVKGNVVRWFGTNTDVTDQRQAQEALKRADRQKDKFLASLAHELRNPLATLSNGLELLKLQGDDRKLSEQTRERMTRQLAHIIRLVDDLLDVSRITRDKLKLHKERVELTGVVSQIIESQIQLAKKDGQQFEVDLPSKPIYVDADPVRLTQILGNLVNNACKYTANGGRIRITVRRCADDVLVSVKDNGRGIPQDMLDKIFSMFMQVDATYEFSQEGLGIGLTLARRLAIMHGGSITVHSDGPGTGSEFVVRLPMLKESAGIDDAARSQFKSSPTISKIRVLVIDDNQDAARTLALLLNSQGYEAHTAHDGMAALQAAEELRPAVIFLDISLPGMDGCQVCREIRKRPWGKSIAIIATTGWGQEKDRLQSQNAGFDDHWVKPIPLSKINAFLETVDPVASPPV